MKIGIDIHGVGNKLPEFFSELSRLFIESGGEIHIMIGKMKSHGAIDEIENLGIKYTHFFSVADHHRELGTKMWYDKKGNPWVSNEDWDKTKAEYAKKHGLDVVIDDTHRYHKYFTTPFMYVKIFTDGEQDIKEKDNEFSLIKYINNKLSWWTHPKSKLGKEN